MTLSVDKKSGGKNITNNSLQDAQYCALSLSPSTDRWHRIEGYSLANGGGAMQTSATGLTASFFRGLTAHRVCTFHCALACRSFNPHFCNKCASPQHLRLVPRGGSCQSKSLS